MHKLTDHIAAWIAIIEKYAAEASGIGGVGLASIGLVTGLLHGVSAILVHSPVTIAVPIPPPTIQ